MAVAPSHSGKQGAREGYPEAAHRGATFLTWLKAWPSRQFSSLLHPHCACLLAACNPGSPAQLGIPSADSGPTSAWPGLCLNLTEAGDTDMLMFPTTRNVKRIISLNFPWKNWRCDTGRSFEWRARKPEPPLSSASY